MQSSVSTEYGVRSTAEYGVTENRTRPVTGTGIPSGPSTLTRPSHGEGADPSDRRRKPRMVTRVSQASPEVAG